MAELTDEQIAREEEFLSGMPRVNLGALFLPPVWGAAHGLWVAILFYPLWLVADNCFYGAFANPSPLSIGLALIVLVSLVAATVVFAVLGQPFAAHWSAARGVTKEQYLRRQRVWAAVSIIVGVAMVAAATYYNLEIRPTLPEL